MTTNYRMNSIRPDQNIAANFSRRLAGRAINEMRGHALVVLHKGIEMPARADIFFAEARLGFFQQQHLQPAAMNRVLRPAVAGIQSARLAPD